MNPIAAQQALKVASSLWGQFNKYRKEKAAQAYSALEEAASNVKENADTFSDDAESNFSEARKQAGAAGQIQQNRRAGMKFLNDAVKISRPARIGDVVGQLIIKAREGIIAHGPFPASQKQFDSRRCRS